MSKFLLNTSALVAATVFAAPALSAERIQLDVRGYFVGGVAYTDSDYGQRRIEIATGNSVVTQTGDGGNEINFGSDSEIHFRGSATLDNGLEISFKAELELEDDADIDEVYIQADGGFGRVQFGQNDGVMDQMAVTAPSIFVGHSHMDVDLDLDPFDPIPFRNRANTVGDFTGDDIKISYFTPSMNGFQIGVSYTPNPCKNDTGYSGCVFEEFARNYWEASASWEVDVNNVGFAFSGGYGQGESQSSAEEPSEWTLGANISLGGFTLGGSYKDSNTSGVSTFELTDWDAGASYEDGPWAFNLAYGKREFDSGASFFIPFTNESESWIGGFTYAFGPGMQIGAGVQTHSAGGVTVFGGDNFIDEFDGTSVFLELALEM